MFNPKYLLTIFLLLISYVIFAQQPMEAAAGTEEGWMRSEAKIYVVGAVVLTILIGLLLYVVRIDKKISRLEKK